MGIAHTVELGGLYSRSGYHGYAIVDELEIGFYTELAAELEVDRLSALNPLLMFWLVFFTNTPKDAQLTAREAGLPVFVGLYVNVDTVQLSDISLP